MFWPKIQRKQIKNILIDILLKKREEISLNEKDIQSSFRLRKKKYYILVNQKIRARYINEEINNKRLKDTIEKTKRDIYKLKDYTNFINTLYIIFPFL